jgi:hypothetical protein
VGQLTGPAWDGLSVTHFEISGNTVTAATLPSDRKFIPCSLSFSRLGDWETLLLSPNSRIREKRIKKWRRAWKLQSIERDNREWRDL